jgi:hypothetical protein
MKKITFALMALAVSGAVFAKLPPPPPEAQAAADAAKHKTAWADKVAAYQLCLSQDKVAKQYFKVKNPGGKPSGEIPSCADPGPYVAAQAATAQVGVADSKPVPAAGKPEAPPEKK